MWLGIGVFVFAFGLALRESKASLTYSLSYVVNGDEPEGGNWLTAEFETGPLQNTVILTLTSNLADYPTYYFRQVAFNVDPSVDLQTLTISQSSAWGTVTKRISYKEQDAEDLRGSGIPGRAFDVLLAFPRGSKNRFDNEDWVTYIIFGPGVTENSFRFLNETNAANVEAELTFGGGDSSTIGNVHTPIPAPAWLLGAGLLVFIALRRRIRK